MKVLRRVWFWGDLEGSTMVGEDKASWINGMVHAEARDVFPIYSALLASEALENQFTNFQFSASARPELARKRRVLVQVVRDPREMGGESAVIWVPPGRMQISHPKAALLVLEAITETMRALAPVRGWSSEPLITAATRARELVGALHGMRPEMGSGFRVSAEAVSDVSDVNSLLVLPGTRARV